MLFWRGTVFPYFASVAVAGLSAAGAATYQAFFVRRQLTHTESERTRYQRAIHWAAHEIKYTADIHSEAPASIMAGFATTLPDEKAAPVERDD